MARPDRSGPTTSTTISVRSQVPTSRRVDFRTWAGTVAAYRELRRIDPPGEPADQPRQLAPAIDAVAARLGNTRAVARASYIHPAVVDAWRAGALRPARGSTPTRPPTRAEENEIIRVLEQGSSGTWPGDPPTLDRPFSGLTGGLTVASRRRDRPSVVGSAV